jgi:hypothetical protein
LGIGIGTDQGTRPSNICLKDGKKATDHTLRFSDVFFELAAGEEVKGGPDMKGRKPEEVVGVRVKLNTHKAGTDSSSGVRIGELAHLLLAQDMATWAILRAGEGAVGGDYFCGMVRTGKAGKVQGKTITQKELRTTI